MNRLFISPLIRSIRKNAVISALTDGAKRHNITTQIFQQTPKQLDETDILIIWNRHVNQEEFAKRFESLGGRVLVFENPYLDIPTESYVSVGLGWHNNIKHTPKQLDTGERWNSFGFDINPWRTDGSHVLVTTQAKRLNLVGLGHESYKQPAGWDTRVCKLIRSTTKRHILFRRHPNGYRGDYTPLKAIDKISVSDGQHPIDRDLRNAWCTVVHTSNSATESLLSGIPVFYTGPTIFMQAVSSKMLNNIETPFMPDNRLELFQRIAWAQYSLSEIGNGYFFEVMSNQKSC